MHATTYTTAGWPGRDLPRPGTIDWTGLAVVDPTPAPPSPTRLAPAVREHEACLRSASRFYAQWGE